MSSTNALSDLTLAEKGGAFGVVHGLVRLLRVILY